MQNEMRITEKKAINLNQEETLFVAKFLGVEEELKQTEEGIFALETNAEIFIFTKYGTWNYIRLRKTDENQVFAASAIIDRYYHQYGGVCHILPQQI